MRFRRQLVVGHALLLLVTVVTGTIAMIALHVTSARLEQVTRELTSDITAIQNLQFQAEQLVATSRGYLVDGDPKTMERFDEDVAQVEENLVELEERRADLREDVIAIERATRAYVAVARNAAALRAKTDDPRAVVPLFEQTVAPAHDRFEEVVTSFVRREQDAFVRASREARAFANRSSAVLVATTILGLALAASLAWMSIRRLNAHFARECAATSTARRAVAARDELIAIVSHDLRSPLNTISLGAGLLASAGEQGDTQKRVAMIKRSAEHMEHLIDQLLDVAKLENGKLELAIKPYSIDSLLDGVRALFEARASNAGIELTVRADESSDVLGDPERCLQVAANLVANAIKFTPPGGRITVAATADGDHVRVSVTDTGPGIPDADVPHVFERHWQGRRRGRGSLGLGLYISKQIVDAHGGRIGIETKPGRGSTFWFTLQSARH